LLTKWEKRKKFKIAWQ